MPSFVTMVPDKANILFYYIYFVYITYLLYLLYLKCFLFQFGKKNLRLREVKKLSKVIQLVCDGDSRQPERTIGALTLGRAFLLWHQTTSPERVPPFLPRTVKSAVGHHQPHQSAPLSL